MPSTLTEEESAAIARALAEPRRCRMLMQIGAAPGSLACSALSGVHDVSAATISHHLKELETAGLIEIRRDGRYAHLSIRRDRLRAYAELIASL